MCKIIYSTLVKNYTHTHDMWLFTYVLNVSKLTTWLVESDVSRPRRCETSLSLLLFSSPKDDLDNANPMNALIIVRWCSDICTILVRLPWN